MNEHTCTNNKEYLGTCDKWRKIKNIKEDPNLIRQSLGVWGVTQESDLVLLEQNKTKNSNTCCFFLMSREKVIFLLLCSRQF